MKNTSDDRLIIRRYNYAYLAASNRSHRSYLFLLQFAYLYTRDKPKEIGSPYYLSVEFQFTPCFVQGSSCTVKNRDAYPRD